ncbi:Hypothetical predicted protein [Lecanosticta acicola]|uniref:Aminoglycoside phosphotransferase domain-containing protein n=1 Tax=Lecanosticta acicola TaxID=111012 RepID=A0AAI8YWU8_9PEZI|nr:Hypothetical predicted protein [Lecanosticta acicola]
MTTPSEADLIQVANNLLHPHGLQVGSCKVLQSLWAGYGVTARINATPCPAPQGGLARTLILKYISPPSGREHDEGHFRKVISYQVERHFYEHLAEELPGEIAIAECLGSCAVGGEGVALLLEDLGESFRVAGEKRGVLNATQVRAAVRWLGEFHGFWWGRVANEGTREEMRRPPLEEAKMAGERDGVWLNGGYTYLATRRKEYDSLRGDSSSEWSERLCLPLPQAQGRSITELVAQVLAPSPKPSSQSRIAKYETLIHGDVKSENLFTTLSGHEVAFFDFQYVGLGLGVCDLAKLFTCSVPISMLCTASDPMPHALDLDAGERELLHAYRKAIDPKGKMYPSQELERHWQTALVDWLRFQASWGFWGNTAWLEARVRFILQDEGWRRWVLDAAVGEEACG